MARPESVALAGYYPTPPSLLPILASLVEIEPTPSGWPHVLVDPCAGTGEAIDALARCWFPDTADPGCEVYGIELEAGRHKQLADRLGPDYALRGDAFNFEITGSELPRQGASVLYLNPPYDVDRVHRRLEQRFLERWTCCLAPGAGLLVFVVPHYALSASAAHLSRNFQDVRAWRFPGSSFDAFRQCCVLARRRGVVAPENEMVRRRVERWAANAAQMPELERQARPAFTLRVERPQLHLVPMALDLPRLLASFEPWRDSTTVATHRTVREMIGAKCPVALPPRPAHIALALATGMANGKRITANRPGLPPLLVKGSLRRRLLVADERFNAQGEKVGSVQVQRPRLTLNVLRLDTLEFHELKPGTVPSGAAAIADFNSADLIEHYGTSLGQLMREQFPALHDPANPAHAMRLPVLGRAPFDRQRELICAGLKLLTLGDNPLVTAQVGTGKSTVALSIAGALHPLHFAATVAELRRLGFDATRLRPVERLLVVCPPHLLGTWTTEAKAVLPLHRVVVVRTLADLRQAGEIYVLSREAAKLGHGVAGLQEKHCPRCGADVALEADALAGTRARCQHVDRAAQDRPARLAERLAAALRTSYPYDPHVRHLVGRHRILRFSLPDLPAEDQAIPSPMPPSSAALRPLVAELAALVEESLEEGGRCSALEAALHRLGLAAEMQEELQARFRAAADRCHHEIATWRAGGGSQWDPNISRTKSLRAGLQAVTALVTTPRSSHLQEPDAIACLEALIGLGRWSEAEPCGEPLFQAAPAPRRYPLARYILRRRRSLFDLVVLDEAHEFSTSGSAQEKAAHRLVELPGVPTLALSGSIMGGYASSLFANFWALSPRFRGEFRRDEKQAFVSRYGYRRLYIPVGDEGEAEVVGYGAQSDREEILESPEVRQLGEAPGILPLFLLTHLLPIALVMHKSDLEAELPPYDELPVKIGFGNRDPQAGELEAEYRRLMHVLAERIRKDTFTPLAGKLWGAMSEMPSYLDRASEDLAPFVLRYPASVGGAVIAVAKTFPAAWLSPKEQWIVDRIAAYLRDGRNILVLLRHTGKSDLVRRYQRIFRSHLGEGSVYLDAARVKTEVREEWLDEQVVRPGYRLLLTNPKAVQTGLNNLVHFSRVIWAEGLDYDARLVRQANGRVHRIGQTRDVLVEAPFYVATAQETAIEHVARKIGASEEVDGLSIEGALESAGAGTDDDSIRAAMSMGQAIYADWLERRA